MNIKIKPGKRTKIAEGSCTVRAQNNTHIIHFTDEDKKVLASTYANNSQDIRSDTAVYAESSKYPMEIEVTGSVIKPVEKTTTTANKTNTTTTTTKKTIAKPKKETTK